jgi:hypothetical protein
MAFPEYINKKTPRRFPGAGFGFDLSYFTSSPAPVFGQVLPILALDRGTQAGCHERKRIPPRAWQARSRLRFGSEVR